MTLHSKSRYLYRWYGSRLEMVGRYRGRIRDYSECPSVRMVSSRGVLLSILIFRMPGRRG